ncbi:peptidylprolyl isomerase [Fournierella sp.]|uniref:peptidylprolyl isomerase n=1 Tax=Allofournierella sp. TaxID=1940256 RepID=UPI00307AB68C
MRRFIALAAAAVLAAGLLAGCGGGITGSSIKRPQVESEELQFQTPAEGDPIAIFNTSAGEVRAVLYPDVAPMAVENFTRLAQEGYYDGTSFHRIVFGFVVQGGDASGTGTTGSTIWNNNPYPKEISDQLHHYSGALCAAFSPDEDVSGLSQFYFVQSLPEKLDDSLRTQMEEAGVRTEVIEAYDAAGGLPYLDYTDTVFGQVYEGMDVVDTLAQSEVDENGKPVEDVLLNSVTISTYGAADPDPASSSGETSSSASQASSAAQSTAESTSQSTSQAE